jgi:hypothetical protein
MTSYLYPGHFDLVTPDGYITKIEMQQPNFALAEILIEEISPVFVGYHIEPERLLFNFKSTLAQVGLNAIGKEIQFDQRAKKAFVRVEIHCIGALAQKMLHLLEPGAYIGKLFAADERRRVRNPDYLARMFGRSDREGRPLLSLGGMEGSDFLTIEKLEGRIVAFLKLRDGKLIFSPALEGFLYTLALALKKQYPVRELLRLHLQWQPNVPRIVQESEILLVSLCRCIFAPFSRKLSRNCSPMECITRAPAFCNQIRQPQGTFTNFLAARAKRFMTSLSSFLH